MKAVWPINPLVSGLLDIHQDGTLYKRHTPQSISITTRDENQYYHYTTKKNRERTNALIKVDELMVKSFYHGRYDDSDRLVDIEQLQSYFVYRLKLIDGQHYRVAVSNKQEEYSLHMYLVSSEGSVFSLYNYAWMAPTKTLYASYHLAPEYHDAPPRNPYRYVGGHVLVAWAFISDMSQGKQVHHVDGNPRNNRVGNLRPMTPRDHMRLHRSLLPSFNNKVSFTSKLENTCGHCFQEIESGGVRCECKRYFCKEDVAKHHTFCWYFQNQHDPDFNRFYPCVAESANLSHISINQRGHVRKVGEQQLMKLDIVEGYEAVRTNDMKTGKLVCCRVNRLVALTFKAKDHTNPNDVTI